MTRVDGIDQYRLDKARARRDFNGAAPDYDDIAVLQRRVSDGLIERLEMMAVHPGRVLDLGSGTGRSAYALGRLYRRARLIQADFAANMLRTARNRNRPIFSRHSFLCTDAESLPLSDACMDLVFSNLMLQWCSDPLRVFQEASRILKPGGLFIFSSLGPDTLRELRDSWKAVDDAIHVNVFIDMHDLGDALMRSGFEHPVMETEFFRLTYANVFGLMRDLKQLGANNVNLGRRRTLTGKGRLEAMIAEYEKSRRGDVLPATYEVVYGHAWKNTRSGPDTNADAKAPVKVPVSSIMRRRP